MLKAVRQIEKSDKKGVILLALDHMVVNDYIKNAINELPSIIQEVIVAALPKGNEFNTIGAVVEWVKWDESEKYLSTAMPIMLEEKRNVENEEIIKAVWQAMSLDDISTCSIQYID